MQTSEPPSHMPHRLLDFCDSIIIGLIALVSAIGTQVLVGTSPESEMAELRILLVPLISGLIATGGLYLFNIGKEPRNLVLGRAVFGLLFGACTIPVVSVIWPSMEPVLRRPIILLPGGAILCVLYYYLSYPLARGVSSRSGGLADGLLDEAERRAGLPVQAGKTLKEVKIKEYVAGREDQKVISENENSQDP